MNQQTAKLRSETDALQLKAGLVQAERLDGDPNIAAALESVRGTPKAGTGSHSDRLAALDAGLEKPHLRQAS